MTLKSEKITEPLEAWVPLYLHSVRDRKQYTLTASEFLPEFYVHPVFLFLGPKGEEIGPEFLLCHEALTPAQLTGKLKEALEKTSTGLTRGQYAKAKELFTKALRQIEEGKASEAVKNLKRLSMLEAECGLRRRARALAAELQGAADFLWKLGIAAAELGAVDIGEEIYEHLKEHCGGLVLPAVMEHLKTALKEAKAREQEEGQAFSDAFYAVISRDYAEAAEALSGAGPAARLLTPLAKKLAAQGFSVDWTGIHTKGDEKIYHDLRVAFTTGAAESNRVRIQYFFLTDKGRLLGGYEEFAQVKALSSHRCAAALSIDALKGEKITNARAELYVNGELAGALNLKDAAKEWWRKAGAEGILFYGSGECAWSSPGLKASARGAGYPSGDE